MDDDVDMDAPQISTLREEATPPLKAKRIKLLDDDQEDQLIDDDEPIPTSNVPSPRNPPAGSPSSDLAHALNLASGAGSSASAPAAAKRKSPVKKKPRKSDKHVKPPEEGRFREKVMQQPGAPNLAPTLLWFEANPSAESQEPGGLASEAGGQISMLGPDPPLSMKIAPKKKAAAKKAPAPKKAKTAAVASKPLKIKLLPPPIPEDSGIVSEGMTGTAASSPIIPAFDDMDQTPEPDMRSSLPPAFHNNIPEEINLDGIPVPVYSLPTKPFPVLPPPKVGSGFAPNIPLDRSGTKVRHWRVARREIRGIGGGRWFSQGWVGEKESAFANMLETQTELRKAIGDAPVSTPKSLSVTGKGKGKGKGSSLSTSAAPSRSESQAPDGTMATSASASVRAPTKMRILQMPVSVAPSSEAGDSDMMGI
ncbi:hypothetical protein BDP27DRAFT_1423218 [Rhodocollybia butyracea]|uniref:Uncharacterized protein n=1 Tax=Rhodocollybia butyracea TaxID=206335 RepID=A0A9P5U4R8_9AGAR|nr:hypothetical protein BDP27DRAFT_1423218 [Rhodocollybia butyracea]